MGTIDEVFEWVDYTSWTWLELSTMKQDYISRFSLEKKKIRRNIKNELEYELESTKYIRILERALSTATEYSCRFIFKRLLRSAHMYLDHQPEKILDPFFPAYDVDGLKSAVYWDLRTFYSSVNDLSTEVGLNIEQLCGFIIPYESLAIDNMELEFRQKYKTLPRTHRIAAVKELIRKSGLCRNIDDTKISAFVEAVTGGNIEAKGGNTISYKTPTKEAQTAAAEWLKKIGIE